MGFPRSSPSLEQRRDKGPFLGSRTHRSFTNDDDGYGYNKINEMSRESLFLPRVLTYYLSLSTGGAG